MNATSFARRTSQEDSFPDRSSGDLLDMAFFTNWIPVIDDRFYDEFDDSMLSPMASIAEGFPILSPASDDRYSGDIVDDTMTSAALRFPAGDPIDGLMIDPSLVIAADQRSMSEIDRSTFCQNPSITHSLPTGLIDRSRSQWQPRHQTAKCPKREKWYPPLLGSIIARGDIVVHRASQNSRDGSERITVHMKSLEDGYKWRKYGQKSVKGNIHPRSYYKCTYQGCQCRKQVEKSPKEAGILLSTYDGLHCHPPCPKKISAKTHPEKKVDG